MLQSGKLTAFAIFELFWRNHQGGYAPATQISVEQYLC